ncbi:hypothetical protein CVT25_004174 [Psilocybe cyanescens]|uniref:Phytocyanin domain-containing protein n=1 Tax=Psilocybe cyanescens TaxID=93625 RepID=A0A409X339_PSICY|nr:hypothetical protein CVT25_004174 [Psilocybe cyanescens]
MHFFTSFIASASVLATAVSAATYTVTVGSNAGLTYEPSSLSGVLAGDKISFKFLSKNHTLTQSTFATPCVAKADGVDSGYVPVAAGATSFPEWTIQIDNVTAPLWFYCAQGAHCKAGMVFAINPTPERTFASFLAAAKGEATTGTGATTGSTATPGGTGANTNSTTTPGGTGAAGAGNTTDSANAGSTPDSGAFAVSAQKVTTFLVALGVVGLML